ncbi:hypothetical protein B5G03_14350 [Gemmiger sp. An50]|nr:hypothetical protein B5G03_14350 [Gemmiger sp. An50]
MFFNVGKRDDPYMLTKPLVFRRFMRYFQQCSSSHVNVGVLDSRIFPEDYKTIYIIWIDF